MPAAPPTEADTLREQLAEARADAATWRAKHEHLFAEADRVAGECNGLHDLIRLMSNELVSLRGQR